MTPLILALVATPAAAQSQATLLEGESELAACLEADGCGQALIQLVSENMAEYGFVVQADPIATSALGGKGMGLVTELRVDTVELGPKNALEQLILIPPALPRVAVGYQYGSYTFDDPYPQLAASLTVLPPFRLFGGTLVAGQLDLGGALPVVDSVLWVGAEVGYGYGQLSVPLVGTRAQLRQIEAFAPYVPPGGNRCDEGEGSCLDQFRQHAVHVRLGVSFDPVPATFFYARVAGVGIHQRLDVAFDDTLWGSGGLQAQAQLGGGIRAGDRYQLGLGTAIASRPRALSTHDRPTMVKAILSTSFRFGRARYWESRSDDSSTASAWASSPGAS